MAYHAKRQGEDAFKRKQPEKIQNVLYALNQYPKGANAMFQDMATLFVINAIKHGWKKAENWGVFPVQK